MLQPSMTSSGSLKARWASCQTRYKTCSAWRPGTSRLAAQQPPGGACSSMVTARAAVIPPLSPSQACFHTALMARARGAGGVVVAELRSAPQCSAVVHHWRSVAPWGRLRDRLPGRHLRRRPPVSGPALPSLGARRDWLVSAWLPPSSCSFRSLPPTLSQTLHTG